ncbi:MAG: Lrp/AsnC ligand binding domain-containing protein [Armatimonadota bacterium]|nr:Lrp/AsnC ligand binding domain-containing protein [Armatimonadota bacterium]MDR5698134.1 Lrp/AsnC ligand binding domain-containing protein [Armatimonadota bacterium]
MKAVVAILLIKAEPGKAREAANAIARIPGCRQTHVVTGPYDIVCFAEADDITALGDMVVARVQTVPGVRDTLTCLVV